MGVNLTRYKVVAFTISSFYAGIAGALMFSASGHFTPESFNLLLSVQFIAIVLIGGVATISGTIMGAMLIAILPRIASELPAIVRMLPNYAQLLERARQRGRWTVRVACDTGNVDCVYLLDPATPLQFHLCHVADRSQAHRALSVAELAHLGGVGAAQRLGASAAPVAFGQSLAISRARSVGIDPNFTVLHAPTPAMPHHTRKSQVELAIRESDLGLSQAAPTAIASRDEVERERVVEALDGWAHTAEGGVERVRELFGLRDWNEERTAERWALLMEAGLVPEARRDRWGRADARDDDALFGREMAFDHRQILADALGRVRGKIKYTPAALMALTGPEATLDELQAACEAIAGRPLHRSNFRRAVAPAEHGKSRAPRIVARTGRRRPRQGKGPGVAPELYAFLPDAVRARLDTSIRFPWLHLAPEESA